MINAGDGWHEHPTQALLDCFTVRQVLAERKGVAPEDLGIGCFDGLRVADRRRRPPQPGGPLRGPGLRALGAARHPGRAGQPAATLARRLAGRGGATTSTPRWPTPTWSRCCASRPNGEWVVRPLLREYTAALGVTARRAARPGEDAIVTHPGPMVRGVEIASDVADLPRTVVTQQVTNGVAVRMAILFLLLGGERPERLVEVPAVA